jgi:outer membrane protein
MTAVRRLTLILCISASALLAQTSPTSQTTTKSTPAGSTVVVTTQTTEPGQNASPSRPATVTVVASTDKDLEDPRALRLSLNDAIHTALEQNLGIQLSTYDFRESGQILRNAYGPFDPAATALLQRSKSKAPVTSLLSSTNSAVTTVNYGLQEFAPTGGTYGISFDNSRSTNTNRFSNLNPNIGTSVGLGISQPFLRNFGIDVNTRGITIARNNLGISREAFRNVLITTADTVEQAYLDLVYARQNVEVTKQSLFLARDQARITQIRIDVGASAPLDILQPRVAVATAEEDLITATAGVRAAEDHLRQLMNLPVADWDRPILPTDAVTYLPFVVDVNTAVANALAARPELRQADLTIANQRVTYLYARNQTLPRLDFTLNYGFGGAAGTLFDIDPITGARTPVSQTSLGSGLRQITNGDFPSWTVGFQLGIPITNIGARAEAKRAELNVERSSTDKANLEQTIMIDARQAVRNIDTAAQQISATKTAREAAEQNYQAERKRYENGMSTNFNVLQIQGQLDDARRRELQALVGYEKFVADYHRAVGDLLETRNIQVSDPETFSTPRIPFQNVRLLNFGSYVNDDTRAPK